MYEILKDCNDFCEQEFRNIINKVIEESYVFDVPLKELNDVLYIGECFHGPTMTCKDFVRDFK